MRNTLSMGTGKGATSKAALVRVDGSMLCVMLLMAPHALIVRLQIFQFGFNQPTNFGACGAARTVDAFMFVVHK